MRRYPQPHSLQRYTRMPWYVIKLHGAWKREGDDSSILACIFPQYAFAPVQTSPRRTNGHRGGVYTRDGR